MIQEDSSQVKFTTLYPWAGEIFLCIKKDLKGEYLRQNPSVTQKYFQKRPMDKLTHEELVEACLKEIAQGNEGLAEWAGARWVVKNAELYHYFAGELAKINPQFDQIDVIPEAIETPLLRVAIDQFGAKRTYIFCILNAVRLSKAAESGLRGEAEQEKRSVPIEACKEESLESVKERYEALLQKVTDKYEKRMQGLEKKYLVDMEGMKKQVAQLHKKLGELASVR